LVGVEKVKQKLQNDQDKMFDCILMDFTMPVMDGPTATTEIRALGYNEPIFAVTGNTIQSDIETFMIAGASRLFPKPFNMDRFHEAMSSLI
jgi:CheY-like chemotaxis protein